MKRVWIPAFAVVLFLSIVIDFLVQNGQGHDDFPWSHIIGFFALFGFISSVAIIVISKLLGHYWLQRKENYYDRNANDE